VNRGLRATLRRLKDRLWDHGVRPKTAYVYSSFDGYPYSGLAKGNFRSFPSFSTLHTLIPGSAGTTCTISRALCFQRAEDPTASGVFKRVAFEHPLCGDCIIDALVTMSGRLGLSAFLPDPNRRFGEVQSPQASTPVPRLPLSRNWNSTDFSLSGVLGTTGLNMTIREWTERALIRYRFVIGETPFKFVMLNNIRDFKNVKNINDASAILCFNDDVTRDVKLVRANLTAWFKQKWPQPAAWEIVDTTHNVTSTIRNTTIDGLQ